MKGIFIDRFQSIFLWISHLKSTVVTDQQVSLERERFQSIFLWISHLKTAPRLAVEIIRY